MYSSRAALVAAAGLGFAAGCGSSTPSTRSPQAEQIWAANAAGMIGVLERDIGLSAAGGGSLAGAGSALRDGSSLYTMVVAYSDFGGCNHMLDAAGRAPARYAKAERTLGSACALLERASALFTTATRKKDAADLLAATRLASSAIPGLVRARVELGGAG